MKHDTTLGALNTMINLLSEGNSSGKLKMPQTSKSKKLQKPTPVGKTYRIKRYNCTIVAIIKPCSIDGSYSAEILSFVDNKSTYKVGDTIFITNRELELTGTTTGSL